MDSEVGTATSMSAAVMGRFLLVISCHIEVSGMGAGIISIKNSLLLSKKIFTTKPRKKGERINPIY